MSIKPNLNKSETQTRVESLLASDPDVVPPSVAADAVAEFNKRRDDERRATMVNQLGAVANRTNRAVENLRAVRKQERAAKAFLDALTAAEEKFRVDGNWSEYIKAQGAAERELTK